MKPVLTQVSAWWDTVTPLADGRLPLVHQAAMGNSLIPQPPLLVEEVLGTGRLPDNFVGALSIRFRVTDKEGGTLLLNLRSGQGLHTYLGILAARLESAPGMECLALLTVDYDEEVHVLHSFSPTQVGPYAAERRFLDFSEGLPLEGLPPLAEIPVASLAVRRAVSSFPREDHAVHVEGMPHSEWQTAPCKRAERKEYGRDLSCQGLTFLPMATAARLLCAPQNILEASHLLLLLISS